MVKFKRFFGSSAGRKNLLYSLTSLKSFNFRGASWAAEEKHGWLGHVAQQQQQLVASASLNKKAGSRAKPLSAVVLNNCVVWPPERLTNKSPTLRSKFKTDTEFREEPPPPPPREPSAI